MLFGLIIKDFFFWNWIIKDLFQINKRCIFVLRALHISGKKHVFLLFCFVTGTYMWFHTSVIECTMDLELSVLDLKLTISDIFVCLAIQYEHLIPTATTWYRRTCSQKINRLDFVRWYPVTRKNRDMRYYFVSAL